MQEMKTKPTQQAVRLLGQEGILPDFIICRAKQPLDDIRKKKIEQCSMCMRIRLFQRRILKPFMKCRFI